MSCAPSKAVQAGIIASSCKRSVPVSSGYSVPVPSGYSVPVPSGYSVPVPSGYSVPVPSGYSVPVPSGYSRENSKVLIGVILSIYGSKRKKAQ